MEFSETNPDIEKGPPSDIEKPLPVYTFSDHILDAISRVLVPFAIPGYMFTLNDVLKLYENKHAFSISWWTGGILLVIWIWATVYLNERHISRSEETADTSAVGERPDVVQSGEMERNTVVGGFKLHEWGFEEIQK